MTLPRLHAPSVLRIAAGLLITDHETGARAPWKVNAEQKLIIEAACAHQYVYVAKPRQVGSSTAVCLINAVWTAACDADGHRVTCAIVVDTQDKSRERIAITGDMLRQMGATCTILVDEIQFPGGSRIVGLTAGGNEVGASLTVQRYHLTELPYWRDPTQAYSALMQSLTLDGCCVLETTLDIVEPRAKELWQNENDYKKLFFNVEAHDEYRYDPAYISDTQWEGLQGEGYTLREAASWFQHTVDTRFGGDLVNAFKKFPQLERHMFSAAQGRWVQITSKVTRPVDSIVTRPPRISIETGRVEMGSESWSTDVWVPLEQTSGQVVVAVDTSAGLGRDRSVVLVRDKRDGRLCAVFAESTIPTDDLGAVIYDVVKAYTPTLLNFARQEMPGRPPIVLVEDNGIGAATVVSARRRGVQVQNVTTTAQSQYQGMLAARREVESLRAFGPQVLADECDACHVHISKVAAERGVTSLDFRGRKDVLMTLGIACLEEQRVPYEAPKEVPRGPVMDGKAIMKMRGRMQNGGLR